MQNGVKSDCCSGGRRFESGLQPFFLTILAVFFFYNINNSDS